MVSPFLDRQHGTELCIIEQIERLARHDGWRIELYSQHVEQLDGVRSIYDSAGNSQNAIFWHKVSAVPGPHLLGYVWWFLANHAVRWWHRRWNLVRPDLTYSPGINCLDADVVVVHIVFHAFYERVRAQLQLNRLPITNWPLLIHRRLYYRLIMSLEQKIYTNPRVHLVAVSTLVAKQLETYFRRTEVSVIPNAVDTERFSPGARLARRAGAREQLSLSMNEFALLLIGNDWKKKGLDTLLQALALLPEIFMRLIVVGSDDPALYQPLLEQLSLQDRVRLEKPSSDVLRFYAAADLYAGPSLEDAFNLPILEAMACGLPVVASVQAGASENIRDGETGLLLRDPQDHRELARLLRRLAADPSLRSRMGTAASQYVQANCTWNRNACRTRELLEATFRNRKSGA